MKKEKGARAHREHRSKKGRKKWTGYEYRSHIQRIKRKEEYKLKDLTNEAISNGIPTNLL